MKFLKTIAIAIFLFLALNAVKAQETWTLDRFMGGNAISLAWSDLDSLEYDTYSTWSSDLSLIDGQTIYVTFKFTGGNTTAGNDSVRVILEGRINSNLYKDADTIAVVDGDSGMVQGTMTITSFFPEYRIRIEDITGGAAANANWNDCTFYIGFYAKAPDVVYDRRNFIDPYNKP